jgi:hypothetical protein
MHGTIETQETTAHDAHKAIIDETVRDGLTLPETFKEFEAAHVAPDKRAEVAAATLRIVSHQRLDGAATFALSDDLVLVTSFMSDEAEPIYVKQVLGELGYDPKYVDRLKSISPELGSIRRDCIRLALKRTHLLNLTRHSRDVRLDILKAFEAGRKVTAEQIRAWGAEDKVPLDPHVTGGLGSLRALAAARMKASVSIYATLAGKIVTAIEDALARQGKRKSIEKGKLIGEVQADARHAQGQLTSVVYPLAAKASGDVYAKDLPETSDWGRVRSELVTLGMGVEGWPKTGEALNGWLQDEVLPALRWSLDGSGTLADYKSAERVRRAEELERRANEAAQPIVVKTRKARAGGVKAEVKAEATAGAGKAGGAAAAPKPRKARAASPVAAKNPASVPPVAPEMIDALLAEVAQIIR